MFANVFALKPRPAATTRSNNLSAIESGFPRIAQELVTRWQNDDIDPYLKSLLLDDRGGRRGFPDEVLDEIMFLSILHWQQTRPVRGTERVEAPFNFHAVSHRDTRSSEPGHVWVLG